MPKSTWINAKSERARESVEGVSRVMGRRTGIIHYILDLMIEPDDPRLFHAVAHVTNTTRLYGNGGNLGNSGTGLSREMAMASAIGETIERFCCALYDRRSLTVSSYAQLQSCGVRAVPPHTLALFSEQQYMQTEFSYRRFTEDTEVSWTWGYSLVDKEPILVPAFLIYLPYWYDPLNELIVDGVSTGLCCARSLPEAMLGGIYEVVERDAIMIMWMNQLPCPQLQPSTGSWLPSVLQKRFEPSGLDFPIYDITTDIPIPVVFALLIDKYNEGLALTVGASANLDPEAAGLKALLEAAQGRMWLKSLKGESNHTYREDFSDIKSFEDHVRLFSSLDSLPYINFLIHSPTKRDILTIQTLGATEDAGQDLSLCVTALAARGLDVIAVNLTQPDVEELGFYVVKILVPGLVDINPHHAYPLLGGRRLYTVPHTLGYSDHDSCESEMNRIPHPFP